MNVFIKLVGGLSLGLCMIGCATETQEPEPTPSTAPAPGDEPKTPVTPVVVDTHETVTPKAMNQDCYKACRTNSDSGNGEAYFCGCACGGSCIWY